MATLVTSGPGTLRFIRELIEVLSRAQGVIELSEYASLSSGGIQTKTILHMCVGGKK